MDRPLRILHLEDSPLDAELVRAVLDVEKIACEVERVETRDEFLAAVRRGCADVILADYTLPSFDGLSALEIAAVSCPQVPFIFVSGSLGEEVAIESLKRGATDYVLKHRLGRLGPALRRALDEVEQRRAREAAERQIKFQAAMLDQAHNSIIGTDSGGKIVYWNKHAETLFQWQADEVMGRDVIETTVAAPQRARAQALLLTLSERGYLEGEFELQRKDGSRFPAYVVNTVVDNDGQDKGVVGVAIDLTARKQLEEQLRQAQKMEAIGQLAGGVAHDFNNLLTIIMGYAQLLQAQTDSSSPRGREIEEILDAAQRAASLTSQLLAFSRKQVLAPQILDLNAVVADTEKMLRRLIGEHIELVTDFAADLDPVQADPGQLQQVIMNLAVNARDAMPEGGKLIIRTRNAGLNESDVRDYPGCEPGDYVMLTVTDTGLGMDPATVSHIFEPFFTTKEQGKGTGLGLSTVFGIVKQSGGHVAVDSRPGRGTTFQICLPRAQWDAEPAVESAQAGGWLHGDEMILLVEDEAAVRALSAKLLRTHGYTVLEAADGEAALSLLQSERASVGLLITDVIMPRMSGKTLANLLKARQPDMKVLFTSGYTDDAIIHHGVLAPGVVFLQKPFAPDVLIRKVREVLDQPAA
ncbi:MAG TPA: response regulator [Blastocatellia bacterium]|nr:response regulator [Blastocatellia bacterium]